MIKSLICITFAYILILGLIAMYNMEYIIGNTFGLPYRSIIMWAAGAYIALLIIYAFISLVVYAVRYNRARNRVRKYFRYLQYLRKNYQSDETGITEG